MSERDIVERLDEIAELMRQFGGVEAPRPLTDAAAKITRLRAENIGLLAVVAEFVAAHEAGDGHGYSKIIKAARSVLNTTQNQKEHKDG